MDDVLGVEVTSAGVAAGLAQASGVYQYLKDSLGSILDVTDSAGNRIQHYVYSAFGTLLGIQDALANDVTAHPPLKTSYGFTGRELDSESGLMYYRARYYDPTLGRFLQKDLHPEKLSLPVSVVNSYAYSMNNPINLRDPAGRFAGAGINAAVGRPWNDSLGAAILIGAVARAAAGGITAAITGGASASAGAGEGSVNGTQLARAEPVSGVYSTTPDLFTDPFEPLRILQGCAESNAAPGLCVSIPPGVPQMACGAVGAAAVPDCAFMSI